MVIKIIIDIYLQAKVTKSSTVVDFAKFEFSAKIRSAKIPKKNICYTQLVFLFSVKNYF